MLEPMETSQPAIGVIGGSGLYDLEGLSSLEQIEVSTPFGPPSDVLHSGELAGRRVVFLPRHGRGHKVAPHEINHQANIYALRSLDVHWLLCVTAVGSLQERYHPRDVVVPDQLFDRTTRREHHTFFGQGIVAHVSFADPFSENLRQLILDACVDLKIKHHAGGVYVNMDGPAFSTRAESNTNKAMGFDVIGMTNLPEAKLAREAEIACATIACITDYDCWKTDEPPVTAEIVGSHLQANVATARSILSHVIPRIPEQANWPEHRSLDGAIQTPRNLWPSETAEKLSALLGRFLS